MFGELKSVQISIENKEIKRNEIFEKGKIDKRIQILIKELREKNEGFGYVNQSRNNFITFEGNPIAVIRTYSSDSKNVGFSINKDIINEFAVVALVYISNNNSIEEIYWIPKGANFIPASEKISRSELENNGCKCTEIGVDKGFADLYGKIEGVIDNL